MRDSVGSYGFKLSAFFPVAFGRLAVRGEIFCKKLQRNEIAELCVFSLEGDTPSAAAQLFDDAVVGNCSSREWRRIGHGRQCYAAPSDKSTRRITNAKNGR